MYDLSFANGEEGSMASGPAGITYEDPVQMEEKKRLMRRFEGGQPGDDNDSDIELISVGPPPPAARGPRKRAMKGNSRKNTG